MVQSNEELGDAHGRSVGRSHDGRRGAANDFRNLLLLLLLLLGSHLLLHLMLDLLLLLVLLMLEVERLRLEVRPYHFDGQECDFPLSFLPFSFRISTKSAPFSLFSLSSPDVATWSSQISQASCC